ncbi:hypothetical protein SFUMM280S_01628 [Streptomyces fumanus]
MAKSKPVSARPYRVTVRVTSWLQSTQVAGAPTGACSASVVSMAARSPSASQGQVMKEKLKAVCSSSGRR